MKNAIHKLPKTAGLFCLSLLLLTACSNSNEEEEARPEAESVEIRPEVVFTVVDDSPLEFYIESRGVAEPRDRIQIMPRISGFVEQHALQEGNRVQKGDLLLQLSDEEYRNEVEKAHNAYLIAKQDYDIEKRARDAFLKAAADSGREGTNGSAAQNEEMIRINSGLAEAELALEQAKLTLSYTTINAPFTGRISSKEVLSAGAYVSAGKELGSLIDDQVVNIRFDLLESEMQQMQEGMEAELYSPRGDTLKGQITAVSPEVDPETKTGQVLVQVDNPEGKIRTGMTIDGRIYMRSVQSKVKAPREVLLARDGRTLVFKLSEEEVQWIYVDPVEMNTEWILLNHPDINPGDTLAVDQHFSIVHQQKVIPLMN